MTEALIERGWFWWGDEEFPKGAFAPDEYIAGTLTIESDGRIHIELDGVLAKSDEPFSTFSDRSIKPTRMIAGLLKSSNKYILASDVHHTGLRWASNGICFDRFSAQICLVSDKRLPCAPRVRHLAVDLAGYEEWLRLGQSNQKVTSRGVALRYKVRPDVRYRGAEGSIIVSHDVRVEVNGAFGSRGIELREAVAFRFRPQRSIDLIKAIETYTSIQDFFIILTGSEYQLNWPLVQLTTHQKCTMYFHASKNISEPPNANQCITSFPVIEEEFGRMFFTWLEKRAELGPGVYLYLSVRRGERVYEEHRLTSLVSGLETLHRSLFNDPSSPAIEARIARILADVKDAKDQEWLCKRTRNFGDPSLEQRLREILQPVAIGIEPTRLNTFCTLCAGIRNDLFHNGRSRKADASENYLQYLNNISSVLRYLYHARIMVEIGVPAPIVERWLTNSHDSFRINWHMEQTGLRESKSANEGHASA